LVSRTLTVKSVQEVVLRTSKLVSTTEASLELCLYSERKERSWETGILTVKFRSKCVNFSGCITVEAHPYRQVRLYVMLVSRVFVSFF
jgi:hypothetical protein